MMQAFDTGPTLLHSQMQAELTRLMDQHNWYVMLVIQSKVNEAYGREVPLHEMVPLVERVVYAEGRPGWEAYRLKVPPPGVPSKLIEVDFERAFNIHDDGGHFVFCNYLR